MMPFELLDRWLTRFPRLTIGLVGDLFLDRYLELVPGAHELSIETNLEAYQVENVRNVPGALGTVLNNLAALQVGLLVPVTVIGDDGHGYDLLQELRDLPVDTNRIVCDANRLTPTYTKPLRRDDRGAWHELNRLDVRTRAPLTDESTEAVCRHLQEVWETSDGLIVLDQMRDASQGVVNPQVVACLRQLARQNPDKLLYVDSRAGLGAFDFGVLKGNRSELTAACGIPNEGSNAAAIASERLAARTQRTVYCTCGDEGILVTSPKGSSDLVPGCPVAGPVDIVGAGDAATSGIVASWLAGAAPAEAAAVGNLVASITVQQLGTTGTATPDEVRARWREVNR